MAEVLEIIDRYCAGNAELRDIVLTHSRMVAEMAEEIVESRRLDVDRKFVYEAAMLHDIGICRCDAPSIFCFGTQPYICHGVEGRKILEAEGLPRHALVCERHTGSGLTVDDIVALNLPLPHRDMTPQSLEEKLICYADKFYSKTPGRLAERKPQERVIASISRHGAEAEARFMELHNLFTA